MSIVTKDSDSDFPPNWKWEQEELLEARHVEFRRVNGHNGPVVVWELQLHDGQQVTVWVEPAILKAKLQDELRRRLRDGGTATLHDGEQVRINPGTKRISKQTAGQTVWPFPLVWFEFGAQDATAEELLLGVDDAGDGGDALVEATGGPEDDAIPF